MIFVRKEKADDLIDIHRVNELAFERLNEADLVDSLRKNAHPHISLVGVEGEGKDEKIVGHIFFSPVTIEENNSSFTAMGLAPMAVLPSHQNRGIGSLLVREGLKECQRIGHDVVIVLGHADYYPRFGFTTAKEKGLSCEYPAPDEIFMVAELAPNALRGRTGKVFYHPDFKKV
jgi:putative acetyltransferase